MKNIVRYIVEQLSKVVLPAAILLFSLSCSATQPKADKPHSVRPGADLLLEKYLDSIANKRVGIVCNQTSVLSNGTHLVDTLVSKEIKVTALFGPEHGIRGAVAAGEKVGQAIDAKTGIPVYSLYGKTQKPAPEMLKNVDVLIFDIQDVGARFYTYISTLGYCLEAAGENHKKIIVLDRPNPINGIDIDGPVLDTAFKSFVGMFPVPIRHGMTIGELAKMIVGEGWVKNSSDIDLQVVPVENWSRSMWYDETNLPWVAPSPNMKSLSTATVYPGTCLFEATNVSEGRGTAKPFECIGAPWIDKDSLAAELNGLDHLRGVKFEPMEFTPAADSVAAPNPKFKGERCGGVFVHVTGRSEFRLFETAVAMLHMIQKLYPAKFSVKKDSFNRLAGISGLDGEGKLRVEMDSAPMKKEVEKFKKSRNRYLIYK